MNNIIRHGTVKDFNTSVVVGVGLTVNIWTYQVPNKSVMILTHFSNYLDLAGHWNDVTWTIYRNGVPVTNYETILDQLGLQTEPRKIERLVFQGGDVIRIDAVDAGVIPQPPVLNVGIAVRYETL